jgi:site-specific recombinase XerC
VVYLRVRAQDAAPEWSRPLAAKGPHHTAIEKLFRRAREKAGLPSDLVWYSARHSFATDRLDQTGNIKLVSDALRHQCVTTTQKYLHPSMKNLPGRVNQKNVARAAEALNENLRHIPRHSLELTLPLEGISH